MPNKLPVLDSVPDFVYEVTDCPESVHQAQQYLTVLKSELTDIVTQLHHNFSEISYQFNGQRQAFSQWRNRLLKARRTKQNQITLIKAWLNENRPEPAPPDMAALLKNESLERLVDSQKRRIEFLERAAASNLPTLTAVRKLERETKFLRHAIADICKAAIDATESSSVDRERLDFLHERLSDLDNQVQEVQSSLKMSA